MSQQPGRPRRPSSAGQGAGRPAATQEAKDGSIFDLWQLRRAAANRADEIAVLRRLQHHRLAERRQAEEHDRDSQTGKIFSGHQHLAPQSGAIICDTQLCELANPAKWDNEEWLTILRSLGLSDDKLSMHRKPYEFTQLIYGCQRLGALREDSEIISVGAGHELVLYWLANQAKRVVATDMYEGVWQDVQGREGDPDVLNRPEDYAPYPYRKDHLVFKEDGRAPARLPGPHLRHRLLALVD